ncbi:MAG TPA: hypothetical protein VIK03_04245, partial [Thermoleophilia bacterium]
MGRTFLLGCVLLLVLAAPATPAAADQSSDVRPPSPSPVTLDGPPPVTVAHGADARWHNTAVAVAFTATSPV